MLIEIQCPGCGAKTRADDSLSGRRLACPSCGAGFDFPSGVQSTVADAAATDSVRTRHGDEDDDENRATQPLRIPGYGSKADLFAGRYEFRRLLGEGGMGRVELHLDTWMNREVALKVPNARALGDPRARDRFLREAQTLAKLRNASVCHVLDVNVEHEPIFFTMEYVEGHPLDRVLESRGPLPPREAAALVRTLALALADTHAKQVVHRDLKPSNILMVDGRPILIDFGLALSLDDRSSTSGSHKGTLRYMSPEQVQAEPSRIGPATDIFSLGVILYQLLTGSLPFEADSYVGLFSQILMLDPDPPSRRRPGLDPELDAICARAMAKPIEKRYANMAEFADAITAWLGDSMAMQAVPRAPAKPAAPVDASTWPDPPDPPARRGVPLKALGLIGAGLVVVAIVLAAVVSPTIGPAGGPTPTPTPTGASRSAGPATKSGFAGTIGIAFVDLPPGTFTMGVSRERAELFVSRFPATDIKVFDDQQPRHSVKITRPFAMSTHEVTVGQFRAFVRNAAYKTEAEAKPEGGWGIDTAKEAFVQSPKYTWRDPGFTQEPRHPVVVVSWNDARAFCDWLNKKSEGENVFYRLPTEAEWEYACRAGSAEDTFFSFGDEISELSKRVNIGAPKILAGPNSKATKKVRMIATDGFQFTAPVGSFPANAWGLYDMEGNVWEWCMDLYDPNFYKQSPMPDDPRGPRRVSPPPRRSLRGGSWFNHFRVVTPSGRMSAEPFERAADKGFRIVRLSRPDE